VARGASRVARGTIIVVTEVAFIWEPVRNQYRGGGALRITLDGRDLSEVVGEHERRYAEAEGHPQIAGGYAGLDPRQLDGPISAHFLGGPGSHLACGPPEKTVLLICTCGEPGCWPLMASIEVRPDEVVWREFEQPHRRGRWSYESFGPFVFDRPQYEQALRSVEDAAGA
jgi:hypothetical protein